MKSHRKKFQFQLNIGFVVFAIIFVYLTITIVVNLMKDNISICRVEEGQIVNSASFTGVCIRDEDVVYASHSGYISFYVGDGEKVAESGKVYLINENHPAENTTAEAYSSISADDYSEMRDQIIVFSKNYTDSHYSQIYSLNYNMQSLSTEMISNSEIKTYEMNMTNGKIVYAASSGIVSYSYDGYEDLSVSDVNKDILYDNSHEVTQVDPYTYIQKGFPVYKTVHNHKWQIVIPLTEDQAVELENIESVDVTFKKDNVETTADFYVSQGTDGKYGVLTLNDYMVRYISERYIDIELVFKEASGLKIPTSALLQKDFYKIPIQYLIEDNRSYESGFYCERVNENGEIVADFRTTGIYYQDDEYFYVSMDDFSLGDYIGKVNSGDQDERFRIGATGKLDGVYNVNKGYTQFEIVKILHKNSDYCIVQENLSYSISLYDNIVLDSDNIIENQIVY